MMRKLLYTALALVVAFSCQKPEEVIPGRVEPDKPDPKPGESEYADPGVEPHKDGQPYDTYRGLVMAGYQGWFGTPGDGSPMTAVPNQGWYHYRESEQFRPGVLRNSIDFWPDMSEYTKKYVVGDGDATGYSSPFILPDGSHATVFSSYDESTVLTHFKWMKQYGLDGVFMQRFVGEIQDAKHKDHFDTVLKHAMKGSNEYGRAIAVMYDMGGTTNENMAKSMVADAQKLMDQYHLKDRSTQKYYLYENGKPLLALWGFGFNDSNLPKPSFIEPYIEQLQAQGWAIMLGCPGYWRAGGNDALSGTEHRKMIEIIKKCDAFIPWYVGRYGNDNFESNEWLTRIKDDIAEAKKYSTDGHVVVYAPHVFPGGSDRNMHPNNGYPDGDATNTGFRFGGRFYWKQFYRDIKAGAQAIYVARVRGPVQRPVQEGQCPRRVRLHLRRRLLGDQLHERKLPDELFGTDRGRHSLEQEDLRPGHPLPGHRRQPPHRLVPVPDRRGGEDAPRRSEDDPGHADQISKNQDENHTTPDHTGRHGRLSARAFLRVQQDARRRGGRRAPDARQPFHHRALPGRPFRPRVERRPPVCLSVP